MLQISNVYAVRMAGVFIISLGTIGMRTRLMPRWLVLVSYLLALVLLQVISVNLWVTLVFPAWVLALSAYLLAEERRRAPALPGNPDAHHHPISLTSKAHPQRHRTFGNRRAFQA